MANDEAKKKAAKRVEKAVRMLEAVDTIIAAIGIVSGHCLLNI
jgi:hypothetical protein